MASAFSPIPGQFYHVQLVSALGHEGRGGRDGLSFHLRCAAAGWSTTVSIRSGKVTRTALLPARVPNYGATSPSFTGIIATKVPPSRFACGIRS